MSQPELSPDRTEPSTPVVENAASPAKPTREELDYIFSGIGPRRRAFNEAFINGTNAAGDWLRQHWLGLVNGALGAYIGLAVLTPIGYAVGLDGPASAVFRAYRVVCDELPSHSFFIGGYQVCLCARCLAIYSTMLLAGLALAFVRHRRLVRSIPWWLWIVGMLPMALDGGTQLFGLRESNVWLRLLTGAIFGLATAWFTLPQIQAAASDEAGPARASIAEFL
ncbi:MAG: DUF2085 domain-containing protein [Ktedonobacterales bacterium]